MEQILTPEELKYLLIIVRTKYRYEIKRSSRIDSQGHDVQAAKSWQLGSLMLKLDGMVNE